MITLYHNPRCSKSREALALLEAKGISPTIVRYLDEPLSTEQLKDLLSKLKLNARDLLRTGEDDYKTLKLADTGLTELQLIKAMIKHPKLIQRPIAVKGNKAIIGRPPEAILELI